MKERLTTLDNSIEAEKNAIERHKQEKLDIQDKINDAQRRVVELQEELKELNEALDEKTKELEAVKKSTAKASRVLDQALKDIATKVSLEKKYTPRTRLSIYVLE